MQPVSWTTAHAGRGRRYGARRHRARKLSPARTPPCHEHPPRDNARRGRRNRVRFALFLESPRAVSRDGPRTFARSRGVKSDRAAPRTIDGRPESVSAARFVRGPGYTPRASEGRYAEIERYWFTQRSQIPVCLQPPASRRARPRSSATVFTRKRYPPKLSRSSRARCAAARHYRYGVEKTVCDDQDRKLVYSLARGRVKIGIWRGVPRGHPAGDHRGVPYKLMFLSFLDWESA